MSPADVLERARRCLGAGCRYHLGAGGMHPSHDYPWGTVPECDCSGFVAWALGVSRQTRNPFYRQQNGGWFETTAIVRDARSPFGFVAEVPWLEARPGDLIVYGDAGGKQGHVGIITLTGPAGPAAVIHCSKGNDTRYRDAIHEGALEPFWQARGALVARVAWVEGAAA